MHGSRKISRDLATLAVSALKTDSKQLKLALKSPKKQVKSKIENDEKTDKKQENDKSDTTVWAGSTGNSIPVCVKCEEEGGIQCTG